MNTYIFESAWGIAVVNARSEEEATDLLAKHEKDPYLAYLAGNRSVQVKKLETSIEGVIAYHAD